LDLRRDGIRLRLRAKAAAPTPPPVVPTRRRQYRYVFLIDTVDDALRWWLGYTQRSIDKPHRYGYDAQLLMLRCGVDDGNTDAPVHLWCYIAVLVNDDGGATHLDADTLMHRLKRMSQRLFTGDDDGYGAAIARSLVPHHHYISVRVGGDDKASPVIWYPRARQEELRGIGGIVFVDEIVTTR